MHADELRHIGTLVHLYIGTSSKSTANYLRLLKTMTAPAETAKQLLNYASSFGVAPPFAMMCVYASIAIRVFHFTLQTMTFNFRWAIFREPFKFSASLRIRHNLCGIFAAVPFDPTSFLLIYIKYRGLSCDFQENVYIMCLGLRDREGAREKAKKKHIPYNFVNVTLEFFFQLFDARRHKHKLSIYASITKYIISSNFTYLLSCLGTTMKKKTHTTYIYRSKNIFVLCSRHKFFGNCEANFSYLLL